MTTPASLQAEVIRLRHELETLHDNIKPESTELTTVGRYLLDRLSELGVTKIFGVPGDFNLGFLDFVEDHPKLEWIGNCNELNASYAADGYARVKQGLGVVITTFGVGELSAVNGIAGAFSEHVPVVHIVGVPNTAQLKNKPMLHHTLGDGRFDAYTKAFEQFTVAQAHLLDATSAAQEIDRVLQTCLSRAKPVYITLPTDVAYFKIPSSRLKVPLALPPLPHEEDVENFVLDSIYKLVEGAHGNVVVLVDACAIRHGVKAEVEELVAKTGFPVYATPMGKTVVRENYERYGGIYVGSITPEDVKVAVESADVILSIGSLKSDFNTGNFTYSIPPAHTIELHSDHTKVQYGMYPGIGMKHLLPKLTAKLEPFSIKSRQISVPKYEGVVPKEDNEIITQSWLWPRLGKFFKPKDIIVAETGTSSFGILDVPLPEGSTFLAQILWGSIGWTVGSTLGAAFGGLDKNLGRTILMIGDGSLQLTVQEISTMIRHGLKPIIFILNNDGYTIERHLHGRDRVYNDIQPWKFPTLLTVFGGEEGKTCQSYTVRTKTELSNLLDDPTFANAEKIQLVEMIMDKYDAPRGLLVQAELSGKTNKYSTIP